MPLRSMRSGPAVFGQRRSSISSEKPRQARDSPRLKWLALGGGCEDPRWGMAGLHRFPESQWTRRSSSASRKKVRPRTRSRGGGGTQKRFCSLVGGKGSRPASSSFRGELIKRGPERLNRIGLVNGIGSFTAQRICFPRCRGNIKENRRSNGPLYWRWEMFALTAVGNKGTGGERSQTMALVARGRSYFGLCAWNGRQDGRARTGLPRKKRPPQFSGAKENAQDELQEDTHWQATTVSPRTQRWVWNWRVSSPARVPP